MTTQVQVHMAGRAVAITTVDRYNGEEARVTQIVKVGEQPPIHLYATTTRTIEVVDLDPSDPRLASGDKPE